MKTTEQTELDFYVQYLRAHIKEHHFEKEDNPRFIESRADAALDTYTGEFSAGHSPHRCHEMAMRTLLEGLYVSRYDVIHAILEEDCWKRLPSSVWEVTAIHLAGLKKINEILDRYEVNGDFLVKEEYPSLRYELLGAITEILDGYEL